MNDALPDVDVTRVRMWCDQKVPHRARHQVRLEHQTHGQAITVVERRVPYDAPRAEYGPGWTRRPLAQLRREPGGWRLYWLDSNGRWHPVDVAPAVSVVPLLEALDDPGRGLLG